MGGQRIHFDERDVSVPALLSLYLKRVASVTWQSGRRKRVASNQTLAKSQRRAKLTPATGHSPLIKASRTRLLNLSRARRSVRRQIGPSSETPPTRRCIAAGLGSRRHQASAVRQLKEPVIAADPSTRERRNIHSRRNRVAPFPTACTTMKNMRKTAPRASTARENRGTDHTKDVENLIAASILGPLSRAAENNTNDHICSIRRDHTRRVDHIELGRSALPSESQDRQVTTRMLGQGLETFQLHPFKTTHTSPFLQLKQGWLCLPEGHPTLSSTEDLRWMNHMETDTADHVTNQTRAKAHSWYYLISHFSPSVACRVSSHLTSPLILHLISYRIASLMSFTCHLSLLCSLHQS